MKQRKGWTMSCDVIKATEELEIELWCRWSNGRVGEWAVIYLKRRKGWIMSCGLGEVTESLENEFYYDYNYELCSFSNLSVTSPTSQLILQPFRRFTYVTGHSPTLPLLHLRHSSFSNHSFASPTSQALHLIHLASRPCSWHAVLSFEACFVCAVKWLPSQNDVILGTCHV